MTLAAHETRLRLLFRGILVGSLAAPLGVAVALAGACRSTTEDTLSDSSDACIPQPTEYDAAVLTCGPDQAPYCEAGSACDKYVLLPCGAPEGTVARTSCYLSPRDCTALCPGPNAPYACLGVGAWCDDGGLYSDRGPAVVECDYCLGAIGRRPNGLRAPAPAAQTNALGDYLARAGHLEAASVFAFRGLARELSAHGAPDDLVVAARRAAREEVRHARIMARLARARGAAPTPVEISPAPARSLVELAIENAVEGCVRETFGALLAHHQGEHAQDPSVASVMATIAVEETRHAALAWAIACWVESALAPAERERVNRATRVAVAALRGELTKAPAAAVASAAGIPSAAVQSTWLDAMNERLWAA